MNILFYVEPWVEKNWPAWRDLWLSMVHEPLCRGLAQLPEARCFFIVGCAQTAALHQFDGWLNYRSAAVTPEELSTLFPDALTAMLAWNDGSASTAQTASMITLLKHKLDGFVPDIIVNYATPAPFLAEAFPQALVLHEEFGCFSRPPFPVTHMFDPCGLLRHSFLTHFQHTLRAQTLSTEEQAFLSTLRQHYGSLLREHSPFTRAQLSAERIFKHLLLLPLQVDACYAFEGQSPYTNQIDMLHSVLQQLPPDIGVVVTEHTDWERSLTPETVVALQQQYPHFLHNPAWNDYLHISQFLLPLVDGIATVSSSLGLQALLWHKPICALGQSQINAVADCTHIAQFPAVLEHGLNEQQRDAQDTLLTFLFTRYIVPASADYLYNPVWLRDRLTQWQNSFQRGVDVDFFPPIDTLPRLLQHYLRHTDRDVPKRRAA